MQLCYTSILMCCAYGVLPFASSVLSGCFLPARRVYVARISISRLNIEAAWVLLCDSVPCVQVH